MVFVTKKIRSKLFPTYPRKRNIFEVTQGRCFPPLSYCNEDQGTSPPNLCRYGATPELRLFCCLGGPLCSLLQKELVRFPMQLLHTCCSTGSLENMQEQHRLMHHLPRLINPVARSRQSWSCSEQGFYVPSMDSLCLAKLSWQEETAHV